MNNYILADIKRIFHKSSFLSTFAIYMGLFLIMIFIYFNPTFTSDAYVVKTKTFLNFFSLFIGLLVFLSVYYDDFKSKSMQVAIGYGIPRYKVVLSKFIEVVLLLLISAFFICIVILIVPTVLKLSLNSTQITDLVFSVIIEVLKSIGYICISAIPVFYTQNAVGGTIFYVLLSSRTIMILLSMILGQSFLTNTVGDLTQYLYTQQLYNVHSRFIQTGTISISLLLAIIIYVLLPVLLSIFSFNKRELEF